MKRKNRLKNTEKKEVRRNKRKNLTVNENSVADIVSDWTKIPVKRLTEGETKRLAALEKELHKRVNRTGRSCQSGCAGC